MDPGSPASDASSWDEERTLVALAHPDAPDDDASSDHSESSPAGDGVQLLALLDRAFPDAAGALGRRVGAALLPPTRARRAAHEHLQQSTDRALARAVTSLRAALVEAGRRAREERGPLADSGAANARTREMFRELLGRYNARAEFAQRRSEAVERKVAQIRAANEGLVPALDALATQVGAMSKKFDAADAQEAEKNRRLVRNLQAQN